MAKCKTTFKKSASEILGLITAHNIMRIPVKIDTFAHNSRLTGCTKFCAQEFLRVRLGLYRVVYETRNLALVTQVLKISHRYSLCKRAKQVGRRHCLVKN